MKIELVTAIRMLALPAAMAVGCAQPGNEIDTDGTDHGSSSSEEGAEEPWLPDGSSELAAPEDGAADPSFVASCQDMPAQGKGALGNPTGKTLGGGEGYGDWVTPVGPPVTTAEELLAQLAEAEFGDVVYVDDDAEIDLGHVDYDSDGDGVVDRFDSPKWETLIPYGVTLASGRGKGGSLGALLFTNDETTDDNPVLFIAAADSRVTGLRIRGPMSPTSLPQCEIDEETGLTEGTCEQFDSRGIKAEGNVEIDNNDIWHFPRNGVELSAPGSHVHHNYIHHTSRMAYYPDCDQRVYGHPPEPEPDPTDPDNDPEPEHMPEPGPGEGAEPKDGEGATIPQYQYLGGPYYCGISYGVSVGAVDTGEGSEAAALIEANVFDHHRHAINGGHAATSYEARYNLVLGHSYSHPFDMHGEFCIYDSDGDGEPDDDCQTSCLWPDPSCHGFVAGTSIEIRENTFLNTEFPSVKIRAKPQEQAWMQCNRYRQPVDDAIIQSGVPDPAKGAEDNADTHFWAGKEPFGSTMVEPFTVIRSDSCCGHYGDYLGVDPVTGALAVFPSFDFQATRWRIVPDDDVIRIVSLSSARYGEYLDINTTTGLAKLYPDPSHTGTKWSKLHYADPDSGKFAHLVSESSGSYHGQYLALDVQDGDLYAYWNKDVPGAHWVFENQQ